MTVSLTLFCVLSLLENALSIDNGLGINPPMGWRSWNCYHANINQALMERVVDAMVDRSRVVNDKPTSYYDLGYKEIGIDDNWQFCLENGTSPGHYFHNDSAPNGWPIVNTTKFPDLKSLISYAHSKHLGIGWYLNNCLCREYNVYPANEMNDIMFLREYDFDGIKLDGCGTSKNISNWQYLINITGNKPLLTENCHNQPNTATHSWCPMNLFRSSGDIEPDYTLIIGQNLQSVKPYNKYPGPAITRPGCFAYPDMLEVGNIEPQQRATSYSMDRTHFGAWVVISAPLIIGYDVTNTTITDKVWDILTNTEALSISQTWSGHPGTLLHESEENIYYKYPKHIQEKIKTNNMKYSHIQSIYEESTEGVILAKYQVWGKPQPNGTWGILMMNNDGRFTQNLTLNFSKIPGLNPVNVKLRSIWDKKDLGSFTNSYTAKNVLPFDSEFLMVRPLSN